MVKYLTYADLRSREKQYIEKFAMNESYVRAKKEAIPVFLSHKHNEDTMIIEMVKGMLRDVGASVYLDWLDRDMPKVTSAETADKLKRKIAQCKKFIVLATP